MPLPAVVVDIGPPPAPPELATTLVTACSHAVADGNCRLAGARGSPPETRAAVRVVWQQPDELRADLYLTLRGPPARRLARTLTFRVADAPVERWRAAGFAIGALVGEAQARPAPSALPPEGSPVAPAEARDQAPSEPEYRRRPIWIGLGALTGPGLSDSTWRFGGWVRGDYTFETLPLLVTLAASYAASPEDERGLGADWLALGVGTGVHFTASAARLEFRMRAELLAERLEVAATDEVSELEDSGSRWAVGPRLGAQLTWPYDSVVAAVAGVSGWTLSDETTIELRGAEVAAAPWAGVALGLGVRVGLP